jgi:Tol biopolymer transport system component
VTRPGYDGVFVVDMNGGEPVRISDGNAFKATWTEDGKIQTIDAEGNRGQAGNAVWTPDSSGLVYEVTTDDGHNLTGGYIPLGGDSDAVSNLTEGDTRITQGPSIGPDGKITFEVGGEVYTGELN